MKASDVASKFMMNDLRIVSYGDASDSELLMVLGWRNHPDIRKFMFTTSEISEDDHLKFSRGLAGREDRFYFILYSGKTPVGAMSVTEIDYLNRSAYLGIYARPDEVIKGVGQMLMHALCHVVFDVMGFHSLRLQVLSSNERAVKFYEKFGFKTDGRLREVYSRRDIFEDVIMMSLLEKEYRGLYE